MEMSVISIVVSAIATIGSLVTGFVISYKKTKVDASKQKIDNNKAMQLMLVESNKTVIDNLQGIISAQNEEIKRLRIRIEELEQQIKLLRNE